MPGVKQETSATRVDSEPSQESEPAPTQAAVLTPVPSSVHPSGELIVEAHAYRNFVPERGTVLHIRVTTGEGRNTYLTFEG